MWVTSPPLEVEESRAALSKVLPNLDEYFRKGQIEIISYDNWYLLGGTVTFESQEGKGTTFIVRCHPPKELNGKRTFKGT